MNLPGGVGDRWPRLLLHGMVTGLAVILALLVFQDVRPFLVGALVGACLAVGEGRT